jgi:glycosyltransferase involved in cell wall biosynthesis
LQNIQIENCSWPGQLDGFLRMLVSPLISFSLIFWLFGQEKSQPKFLIKSLLLVPAFFHILSALKRIKPDLIHLFWGHYPSILAYLVKKTMPGIPLSMFLGAHDLAAKMHISSFMGKKVDFMFTHARANLPLLEEMGIPGDTVTVAHRGIDTESLDKLLTDQSDKNNSRLVLSVGRLQSYKGFDDTLHIFAKLLKKHKDLKLGILGDGPEKDNLIKLAEELGISKSVKFYGHLPHNEVIGLMAKSRLFLFMSRHNGERLPNVVKEAMFCKCICISSDTVGIEELINHGKNGFIVPKTDVTAAADLADQSFSNKFPDLPEAARQKIVNEFSRSRSIQHYLDRWSSRGLK